MIYTTRILLSYLQSAPHGCTELHRIKTNLRPLAGLRMEPSLLEGRLVRDVVLHGLAEDLEVVASLPEEPVGLGVLADPLDDDVGLQGLPVEGGGLEELADLGLHGLELRGGDLGTAEVLVLVVLFEVRAEIGREELN